MSAIGDALKEARMKKKMSIEDVSEGTGIRIQYLEALEKGEYSRIPGEVFIKGFLRNYGNFVDLDGNELVDAYINRKRNKGIEQPLGTPSGIQPPVYKSEVRSREEEVTGSAFEGDTTVLPRPKKKQKEEKKKKSKGFKAWLTNLIYEPEDESVNEMEDSVFVNKQNREFKIENNEEESGGLFNTKLFFVVLAILILVSAAGFMLFMKSKKPETPPPDVKTPFTEAVNQNKVEAEKKANGQIDLKDINPAVAKQGTANPADANKTDANKTAAKTETKSDVPDGAISAGAGANDIILELTFNHECWTQITCDGKTVDATTMKKGDKKIYTAKEKITMDVGSIRYVDVKLNGKAIPYKENEWGAALKTYVK